MPTTQEHRSMEEKRATTKEFQIFENATGSFQSLKLMVSKDMLLQD
jgi:hypothetical protein